MAVRDERLIRGFWRELVEQVKVYAKAAGKPMVEVYLNEFVLIVSIAEFRLSRAEDVASIKVRTPTSSERERRVRPGSEVEFEISVDGQNGTIGVRHESALLSAEEFVAHVLGPIPSLNPLKRT